MAAKTAGNYGAAVATYPAADYAHMRTFTTPDGKAGVAVKSDGDIVSVFKHPDSNARRFVDPALALATQAGGNKLDAFDTVLPKLYSQNGFRAVARVPFDDQYAPPGWDYQKFGDHNGGRPDVVFMVYDPEHAALYKPAMARGSRAMTKASPRRRPRSKSSPARRPGPRCGRKLRKL